jgi:flagellar biosynthesis chaperone FliJ
MKTRYTSLVNVKKNIMQKSERVVQSANAALNNASQALQTSLEELQLIQTPQHGKINEFLSMRALLTSQRAEITHNEEWLAYAKKELFAAKEELKLHMIEFEKFQYLEYQEIAKELQKIKLKEAKDLDEIALITHARKDKTKVA